MQAISYSLPNEADKLYHKPKIKRPNKGCQKYGKYKLMVDLDFAKLDARIQYKARVKIKNKP